MNTAERTMNYIVDEMVPWITLVALVILGALLVFSLTMLVLSLLADPTCVIWSDGLEYCR